MTRSAPQTPPPRPTAADADPLDGIFLRGDVPRIVPVTDPATVPGADVDLLVVPCIAGPSGLSLPDDLPLPRTAVTDLWKTLMETGVTGAAGEVQSVPAPAGVRARQVLAVGLGSTDTGSTAGADGTADPTGRRDRRIRAAAGAASRALRSLPGTALTVLSLLGRYSPTAAVEGHALGAYRYTGLRTAGPAEGGIARLGVLVDGQLAAFARACTVVEAVATARDIVNAPTGSLDPARLAALAAGLAARSGIGAEILDATELGDRRFGGILGAGGGSVHAPRLLRLVHRPEPLAGQDRVPHIALVGAAVTAGSAGAAGVTDLAGSSAAAAAAVAATVAAAELELPVAVTATVPVVELASDAPALRPGSVLRHVDGTTTEISGCDPTTPTDPSDTVRTATSLVLADAVARAVADSPDLLVTVSAVTGSRTLPFGDRTAAVTGSPALRDLLVDLADRAGEDAWAAPLPVESDREIGSEVADLRTAAPDRYLPAFVPAGTPRAHVDVAGPAVNSGAPYGDIPGRASGRPVRTLVALLGSARDYADR
ncbi:M17 family peptidase N-terminal domain-containing protein [Corynebacterium nuruki]|uniref:M17 family peptidase N-terminal domain-containing protein n=1 Tax=Corynebacterium nuruki TaxID=1032851 RepID=UPI002356DCCB